MTLEGFTVSGAPVSAPPRSEVSFRLTRRNEATPVPLAAWTELATDGERVFIRTRRPLALLEAICGAGVDLPGIEVRQLPELRAD